MQMKRRRWFGVLLKRNHTPFMSRWKIIGEVVSRVEKCQLMVRVVRLRAKLEIIYQAGWLGFGDLRQDGNLKLGESEPNAPNFISRFSHLARHFFRRRYSAPLRAWKSPPQCFLTVDVPHVLVITHSAAAHLRNVIDDLFFTQRDHLQLNLIYLLPRLINNTFLKV